MPDLNEESLERLLVETKMLGDGRATYVFREIKLSREQMLALGLDRPPICLVCVPPDGE
jgi:hypothetical protein